MSFYSSFTINVKSKRIFYVICIVKFSPRRIPRLSCRMITISVWDSSLERAFGTRATSEYWNPHCLSPARNSEILAISHFESSTINSLKFHVRRETTLSCRVAIFIADSHQSLYTRFDVLLLLTISETSCWKKFLLTISRNDVPRIK